MTAVGAGLAYLNGLSGWERTGRLADPSTGRIRTLVTRLGNPEREFPSIHVTGTNGKGSTALMATALLQAVGLRIGTYTSPHLSDVTERVRIDGIPVDLAILDQALSEVAHAGARSRITPTWFEAMTAAGLLVFAQQNVDVAVVEVGMLGRWDATNVVDGVVAVITNIELDHTDLAGPTRADIAVEKAGIVKPGSTLILGEPDPVLRPLFLGRGQDCTVAVGEDLTLRLRRTSLDGSVADLRTPWSRHSRIHVGLAGRHQARNALLAVSATEAFLGSALPSETVDSALDGLQHPGRLETVAIGPRVIVDGAHNIAAATALRVALDPAMDGGRRILVYGTLKGRDPQAFLEALGAESFAHIILTEPPSSRAESVAGLETVIGDLGTSTTTRPDVVEALEEARRLAGSSGLVLVAGSLGLVAPARAAATSPGRLPAQRLSP